jgi:hypothetical protein
MVEFGWDNQLQKCTEKIRELRYEPGSLFNQIAAENGYHGFPETFDKLALSEELRTAIFKAFKFKYLKKFSATSAILKNIFNDEFQSIYSSVRDAGGTNSRAVLDAGMNDYFEFVMRNIKPGAMRYHTCSCKEPKTQLISGHLLCSCGKWVVPFEKL